MGDAPETADAQALAALQLRFRRMVGMMLICGVVALVGAVCFFGAHQAWGLWLFIAALVSGFAAQVWFVAAMRR
jgi:cytochrome bd-type quinol oxidase subunit 1